MAAFLYRAWLSTCIVLGLLTAAGAGLGAADGASWELTPRRGVLDKDTAKHHYGLMDDALKREASDLIRDGVDPSEAVTRTLERESSRWGDVEFDVGWHRDKLTAAEFSELVALEELRRKEIRRDLAAAKPPPHPWRAPAMIAAGVLAAVTACLVWFLTFRFGIWLVTGKVQYRPT